MLDWPLMRENITTEDTEALVRFLTATVNYDDVVTMSVPRLTNGDQVRAFEEEFAAWQGSKYAVMVNSGASANLITMQALKIMCGPGRVLVPCITWVSDIAAVLHAGLEPVFVDVDPRTLGMDMWQAAKHNALATFVTHCLGFPALKEWHGGTLIEDCCESLGAQAGGHKLGNFGLMSNFSFYYAHHMSTIEGGMVCTDDARVYQTLRMLRSHGLAREMTDTAYKNAAAETFPDLDPEFIFVHPAYNVRPTEINAVIGRSQLSRLDYQNAKRTANLVAFLNGLDASKYRVDYAMEGSSNYALPLVLQAADAELFSKVLALMGELGVEYRKGTAGGGNQLRQPYARERWGEHYNNFPQAEHIHNYGLYIGNYPGLEVWKIEALCERLNKL